ncbi:hypothetical protein D3C76_1462510 [compost metagenome]
MDEIREVGLLELCVFSQHVVEQIVQLCLLFLLAQEILDESLGLVLKVRVEGRIEWRQMLRAQLRRW